MGVTTHEDTTLGKVTLADTAENLSVGLKVLTEGQISSFDEIKITDSNTLVIDPTTFKNIDTVNQGVVEYSNHNGITVVNDNSTNGSIEVVGSLSEAESIGMWNGTEFASTLTASLTLLT